jgi:hypothetical protein
MSKSRGGKHQPYAYAKKGDDGKWYHWTKLAGRVAGGLAQGAAFGLGFSLTKWLFGDAISQFGLAGLTGDIVRGVKDLFKWQ